MPAAVRSASIRAVTALHSSGSFIVLTSGLIEVRSPALHLPHVPMLAQAVEQVAVLL